MAKKRQVAILVGTKKGGFIFRSEPSRKRWKVQGPLFNGAPVWHMAFDQRDRGTVWAACNSSWGGPRIERSKDAGRTWTTVSNPVFPQGSPHTFKRTWHIEPGHPQQPERTWIGVEPAALFWTEDDGAFWCPVDGLNEHPTRDKWQPGAGGLGLHSIALDPSDAKHVVVGISAAGVFETRDGALSWRPWNEATRAEHLPETKPEVGQCVHHLVAHPETSGVYFQQNHFGVYWRDSGDAKWTERTKGLPSEFGFASAVHPQDPKTAYVIPLDPRLRIAQDPGIAVYRTSDRGKTWRRLDRGLPKGARLEVLREGMATDRLDPAGIYFGTETGQLFASADEGRSWSLVEGYLPPILSVSTATIS